MAASWFHEAGKLCVEQKVRLLNHQHAFVNPATLEVGEKEIETASYAGRRVPHPSSNSPCVGARASSTRLSPSLILRMVIMSKMGLCSSIIGSYVLTAVMSKDGRRIRLGVGECQCRAMIGFHSFVRIFGGGVGLRSIIAFPATPATPSDCCPVARRYQALADLAGRHGRRRCVPVLPASAPG